MNSSGNDDKSNGAESASRLPDVVLSRADALLFDASLDAMLVVDCASGSIVRANESVERLLGYPAGALSGKPFTVLFPADAQSSAESTANEILVHDMVFRQDFRRVDGTLVRLDLTAVMLSPGGHDCIFATLRDTRERDDQERHMVQAARTDALTGLYSRAELLRRLELEHQRSLRYRLPYSVCFCDVDRFKTVNDDFGHIVGDAVLKALSRSIAVELRATDLAGRYGGDEIVILLPHTGASDAYRVVERIRERLASRPLRAGSSIVRVTASFGVAAVTPGETDYDQVLQHADQALYEAKSAGRDRSVVYRDIGEQSNGIDKDSGDFR